MPMNAPPEFNKAMDKYSSARTPQEKLKYLEEALRYLPKHKGTENMRKQLLRKMAELRKEISTKRRVSSGRSYLVPKQGFQAAVWGFPNVGKSYILSVLSGVPIKSTSIPYETSVPTPVMVEWKGGRIQMVELPSYMSRDDSRLYSMILPSIRAADHLILVVNDDSPEYQVKELLNVLEEEGVYLNRDRPPVKVEKQYSGGIRFLSEHLLRGDREDFLEVLQQHGVYNAVIVPYGPITPTDLSLALEEGATFMKYTILVNGEWDGGIKFRGRETLRDLFKSMGIIRVFTKPPRGEISKEAVIMREGSTPEDLAKRIGVKSFNRARIWTEGVYRDIPKDYILKDGDIIEFR